MIGVMTKMAVLETAALPAELHPFRVKVLPYLAALVHTCRHFADMGYVTPKVPETTRHEIVVVLGTRGD